MGFSTIPAERKGNSSSGKMRSLVALTVVLAVASGDMKMMKQIHHDMMMMNSQAMCWGQGNVMYYKLAMMKAMEECEGGHSSSIKPTNPFAQINANALKDFLFNNYRNKRQAGGLIEVTEEDF